MVMNECIAKKPSGLIGGETPTFINGLYKTTNCRSPIFNEPVYWGLIIETIFFYCDDDVDAALLTMNYGCLFFDD